MSEFDVICDEQARAVKNSELLAKDTAGLSKKGVAPPEGDDSQDDGGAGGVPTVAEVVTQPRGDNMDAQLLLLPRRALMLKVLSPINLGPLYLWRILERRVLLHKRVPLGLPLPPMLAIRMLLPLLTSLVRHLPLLRIYEVPAKGHL